MNILVIGLGSMGKRRIRCLLSIGVSYVAGFDLRQDRRDESVGKYGIEVFDSFESAVSRKRFDAFVISVPPDLHHIYMKKALELNVPAFIEASVVDTDLEEIIRKSHENSLLLAPSCTMCFHPAIKRIMEIVRSGELGKISSYLYHSGQYLPDWHTYEKVEDFYVSRKETGGAREIVPFELGWITHLLGFPSRITGFYKKTIDIKGAEQIDDTYSMLMDYGGALFNLTIDVVSRYAVRRLLINGDKKQLYWFWDENVVKVYDPVRQSWDSFPYITTSAEGGYNKNITEQIYVDELDSFLKAVKGEGTFMNSMELDYKVLKLLFKVEESSDTGRTLDF